jgi:hypothetical protein
MKRTVGAGDWFEHTLPGAKSPQAGMKSRRWRQDWCPKMSKLQWQASGLPQGRQEPACFSKLRGPWCTRGVYRQGPRLPHGPTGAAAMINARRGIDDRVGWARHPQPWSIRVLFSFLHSSLSAFQPFSVFSPLPPLPLCLVVLCGLVVPFHVAGFKSPSLHAFFNFLSDGCRAGKRIPVAVIGVVAARGGVRTLPFAAGQCAGFIFFGLLTVAAVLCRTQVSWGAALSILLLGLVLTGIWHVHIEAARNAARRGIRFYQSGLERLDGTCWGKGYPGTELLEPHHPYAVLGRFYKRRVQKVTRTVGLVQHDLKSLATMFECVEAGHFNRERSRRIKGASSGFALPTPSKSWPRCIPGLPPPKIQMCGQ